MSSSRGQIKDHTDTNQDKTTLCNYKQVRNRNLGHVNLGLWWIIEKRRINYPDEMRIRKRMKSRKACTSLKCGTDKTGLPIRGTFKKASLCVCERKRDALALFETNGWERKSVIWGGTREPGDLGLGSGFGPALGLRLRQSTFFL